MMRLSFGTLTIGETCGMVSIKLVVVIIVWPLCGLVNHVYIILFIHGQQLIYHSIIYSLIYLLNVVYMQLSNYD